MTVRPEGFSLGEGPIDARIVDRAYLGETVRVRAELPNGQEVTLSLDEDAPEPGEETTLALDDSWVHVLEA